MIEPSDFLKLAQELAEAEDDEAKYRTAISRAYYSAYHEAKRHYAELKNLELSDSIFENHQRFIRELQNQASRSVKKLGNQLYDLKKDRMCADYQLDTGVSQSKAKKSYAQSVRIIKTSERLHTG